MGTSGLGQKLGEVWGHKVCDKNWEECGDVRSGREKCGAIKSVTKAGRSVGTLGLGQKLGGMWGQRLKTKAGEEHGDVILTKGSKDHPLRQV